ncbi:MAG TPA: transposase [Gemmatimonadaceae bacterium]|nr:transposase [Gemmatimonadaceae bacterium]
MPRSRRLVVPGLPLHITHRGVDRGPTFLAPEDYAYYWWALREGATAAGCAVHAYVLMTNHVHLLLTPDAVESPATLTRSLGRRYVRYFNDRYRRTGTLWEGRYRSTIVGDTAYFFACSRYIELNPVRAKLVDDPAQYSWSSYRHNALGIPDAIVTPRAEYVTLGPDPSSRRTAYRELFRAAPQVTELASIRADVRGRPKLNPSSYRQTLAMAGGEDASGATPPASPAIPASVFSALARSVTT